MAKAVNAKNWSSLIQSWTDGSERSYPQSNRPLGTNLSQIAYYNSEMPFLNLMKSGGSSASLNGYIGWMTSNGTTWDTGEEAYLQLDSDGYPTSLTASPIPSGGQQFTFVKCLIQYNMGTVRPGATYQYPPGPYRLKFIGQGSIQVGGDATALSNPTGGATINGTTVTNSSGSTYVTVDVTVNPSTTGITLAITAINSGTDYPRDISFVLKSRAASYDSGSIFNPDWLATVANISSFRFMDWLETNNEFTGYNASGNSIAAGSTSTTLASAWSRQSGSYPVIFMDGEQRNAVFTVGQTTMDWSADGRGGLANTVTTTFGSQTAVNMHVVNKTWANRSKPSNAFWSLYYGVPFEIMVALGNQLSADIHVNVPMSYSDSDVNALAALIFNGTGMQPGFSPISSSRRVIWEVSNEVWNPGFQQYAVAGSLGGNAFPGHASGGGNADWNRNWIGMRTAQVAQDIKTTLTTAQWAQCDAGISMQITNTTAAGEALSTPYWTGGPASSYPLTAIYLAPYFPEGLSNLSTADSNTITSQADGGVAYLLQCFTSNVMPNSGPTLSSVPSNGWVGQTEGYVSAFVTWLAANYPTLKLIGYEGGQQLVNNLPSGAPLPTALVDAANRDPGMGTIYYNFLRWWNANVGGTKNNILHLFNDIYPAGGYAWGALESVMQTISPLSSAPAKWMAIQNYAQGN